MSTTKLIQIPILTAFIVISVIITPPFLIYGIPFSLQTLMVALIALIVDWKTTLSIICLYIFLGFIGLPVFTGGKNGVMALSSGTFGFIIGFIPYALLLSSIKHYISPTRKSKYICALIVTSIIAIFFLYGSGYLYLYALTQISLPTFITSMIPFFLLDFIKIYVALFASFILQPLFNHFQKS
ncbi:MAG: biotin transporter BioY [Culicoidibacterales bacterium]